MSNATTRPVPEMPAWATEREDSDYHVPGDGFTRFSADSLMQPALTWDQEPCMLAVAPARYSREWDDDDQDRIEVWSLEGVGMLFMLTPNQARELAAVLVKGADTLEAAK